MRRKASASVGAPPGSGAADAALASTAAIDGEAAVQAV
jgi:hypothetical protein